MHAKCACMLIDNDGISLNSVSISEILPVVHGKHEQKLLLCSVILKSYLIKKNRKYLVIYTLHTSLLFIFWLLKIMRTNIKFCDLKWKVFKLPLWFSRREYGVDILGFMTEADYAKIIVWVETDEFDETEGPEHYTGCDYHPVRQIIHFTDISIYKLTCCGYPRQVEQSQPALSEPSQPWMKQICFPAFTSAWFLKMCILYI